MDNIPTHVPPVQVPAPAPTPPPAPYPKKKNLAGAVLFYPTAFLLIFAAIWAVWADYKNLWPFENAPVAQEEVNEEIPAISAVDPSLNPENSQDSEKDCGDYEEGRNSAFVSCVREVFSACTPAVFRLSGTSGQTTTYRITGKVENSCVLHNSAGIVVKDLYAKSSKDIYGEGPITCTIPMAMIEAMKLMPVAKATDMASGDVFTDSLVYIFSSEIKKGDGPANLFGIKGAENLECKRADAAL